MEYRLVAPPGRAFVKRLAVQIEAPESDLPAEVVELCRLHLEQLDDLERKITGIERRLKDEAKSDLRTVRLQMAPDVGAVRARGIQAFAPPMEGFRSGKDFAAWLGLVPVQRWTGGRQILGRTSKMGQRDIRRRLITGAMTRIRWAVKNGPPKGSRFEQMLDRKPRTLVVIALANKTA